MENRSDVKDADGSNTVLVWTPAVGPHQPGGPHIRVTQLDWQGHVDMFPDTTLWTIFLTPKVKHEASAGHRSVGDLFYTKLPQQKNTVEK